MANGYEEDLTLPWTQLHPKVLAGAIVGGLVYVLAGFGVDLGTVLQDIENAVGVDLPNSQALAVGLAGFIAAYLKKITA